MAVAKTGGRQQEFSTKLTRIRSYLKKNKLGGLVLSSQALFAWATAGGDNHVALGHDLGVAHLLVTSNSVTVLANNIEIGRMHAEEFGGITTKIEYATCPWYSPSLIEQEMKRRFAGTPWASDSGFADTARVGDDFMRLTHALTDNEIERYRTLGKDCSLAMEEALKDVRPGTTEHQVAGLICARLWDHAVRPHVILVASDERVHSFRHPIPKDKKISKHLMAVLCGKRGGLIINLTRMVHFGRALPEELRRKHTAACAVDLAFNAATLPGVKMKDVFATGLAEYAAQGYPDEWKMHHQGGPTGYQGRSFLGTLGEERPVLDKQAFAWNPSITGTKSEDTMLVQGREFEFLSAPTRNWPTLTVKRNGKTYRRADIMLV